MGAVVFCGCASLKPARSGTDHTEGATIVTVVSLADFHGALEPLALTTAGGDTIEVGGAGLISAYVSRIREVAPGPVVLVDGGDMWQGTLVSNLREGAPVVRFYNELGVAAAALGNHEFDFGPDGTDRTMPISPDDDPRGALKARVAEADFALLGVNVRLEDDGSVPEWAAKSVVLDEKGLRIGIIGGATVQTPVTTIVANVAGLDFLPLPGPVEEEALRLREDGVDVLIVAVHAGGGCEDNSDPDDLSTCENGELFDLVRALPEGLVDVFTGGHSHKGIAKRKQGAAVMQPYARGRYLTWAEVDAGGTRETKVHGPVRLCGAVVEGPNGPNCYPLHVRRSEESPRPATFLGAEIVSDKEMMALLEDDFDRAERLKRRPLNIDAKREIGRSYDSESPLGNLVADVLLESVDGADAAFVNGGGLRASLPEGSLTYGHVFEALPFDNWVAIMEVDGETLRRIVQHGHSGGHSALSWSGLSFHASGCSVEVIKVGGVKLDESARYKLVTNSYLAGGGSGFGRLDLDIDEESVRMAWDLPLLRDVVAQSLESRGGALRPEDFYSPDSPRQNIEGFCDD